jgi:nucleotide-binding universal stress UspA family protein
MKKVLVALDGSSRQSDVLGAAIALARMARAELVLFRAVGLPADLPTEALSLSPEQVQALLEGRARRDLDALQKHVTSGVKSSIKVLIGSPWQAIEAAARDENVDMIVIGSHGYSGLDRVLGTTAAKVVNHADRAVLVVRAAERITAP